MLKLQMTLKREVGPRKPKKPLRHTLNEMMLVSISIIYQFSSESSGKTPERHETKFFN